MYDEITPNRVNATEERQIQLLLNLVKHREGISFHDIQNRYMKSSYANNNEESDKKKFTRDLEQLKKLGFPIKRYTNSLNENESVYKLHATNDFKLRFAEKELKQISLSIMKHYNDSDPDILLSSAQKIFSGNLNLFPEIRKNKKGKQKPGKDNQTIEKLIGSIRDKIPLRMEYAAMEDEKSTREIEPLRLIKKNSEDFYLVAKDRKDKITKRFIVEKIVKLTELDGDFLYRTEASEKDLNLHPLSVRIHDSVHFSFRCRPEAEWKMKNFLSGHIEHACNEKQFSVSTTNKQALTDFIIRQKDLVIFADPNLIAELQSAYKQLWEIYEPNNI